MTKILLVEDDKSLREIYGVRLLAEGYDIVSAGDGEEALAMAIKERPQLVVSDVMMPKISGFDMLDILRSTTETKNIKVIMMTALSSEDQRQRGEQLGADRYLVKSQVGIEDVVRTVHEVLGDMPNANPAPSPAATPAPQAAPTVTPAAPAPAPAAPAPIAPNPQSGDANASSLPEPTAPFSTARPASLGDRVIHPIDRPAPGGPDLASRMSEELSSSPVSPVTPAAPAAPVPPVEPPKPVATVNEPAVPTIVLPSEPATPPLAPQPTAVAAPDPSPVAPSAPSTQDITANAIRPMPSDSPLEFEETPVPNSSSSQPPQAPAQ